MNTIYFQPPDINPDHCEVGTVMESDPEHIWYLNEPCKVKICDVKIIPKDRVTYDSKRRIHMVEPKLN